MNPKVLLNSLPPYNGKKYLIKKNQNVDDIIKAILEAHEKHREEYKKIAIHFKGRNTRETAKNIWNFLKKNVPYKEEPETNQTIKSPSAIIVTGMYNTEHNDCKNYALFSAGILQGLNDLGFKIPYAFRFASYSIFDKTPQHVFIVVNPGTNKEIWIDPVLKSFDYKKPYTYAKDKKMMYKMSGTGMGAPKKRIFAKIALAPARNAFLALVALNFSNLANKLKAADQKVPGKLKNWWEKLGGRYQTLLNNVKKGEKKRRIFGDETMGGITLGALITAASALIAKIAQFLRDNGINPDNLLQLGKDALNRAVRERIVTTEEIGEQEQIQTDTMLRQAENQQLQTTGTGRNILPIILIGGAAAYFLIRKKK